MWEDVKQDLDDADIPEHLGDLVGKGAVAMAGAAATAAPHVAKAFVDAWLHSGPWTQMASLLFVARKVQKMGGGGGLVKGGIGGLFSRAKPIPVYVVNGMGGGVPGGRSVPATTAKGGRVPGVLKGLGLAALPIAGELALTDFINSQPSTMPRRAALSEDARRSITQAQTVGRGGNASGGQIAYDRAIAQLDAPQPLVANLTLKVGEAVLAKANARAIARTAARRSGGHGTGPQGLPG